MDLWSLFGWTILAAVMILVATWWLLGLVLG